MFCKILFISFLERGEVREKERKRNINELPLVHAPTWDWTCNPGMCPDQESNLRHFALLDDA